MREPPNRISFSSLSTYKQCKKKWKFQYLEDVILVMPSLAQVVGSFVHAVFEAFYLLEKDERTLAAAKALAKDMFEAFSQEDENYLLLELNDLQEAEFKSLSWVLIQSLWALEAPEEIEVVDTEYEINTELNGVQFHGYVDRIDRDDDGLVITDYKTGSTPRLDRFAKDKIEQVTLYSAAVQQELEENVAFARLIFLEKKTKSILGVVPSDARIKHQLKDLKDSWDEIQKSIENDDFPATRQVLCAWCGFLGMCDEGQEEVIERFKAGTLKKTSPAYAAIQDLLQNEVPVQLTVAPRVGP